MLKDAKTCPASLEIREKESKITRRHHFHTGDWHKCKKIDNSRFF
jgi:hypothetical protein